MSKDRTSAGRLLSSRRARRIVVGIVVAVTALLGSLVPASLHGFAILLVLLLAGLDIALIRATDALAFTHGRTLDERERALRDMAYRRGFRLLGLAFVVEILILIATGILAFYISGAAHGLGTSVVDSGIPGRALVGLLEALIMLPTLVIAWVDPDRVTDDEPAGSPRRRLAWLALPAVAAAWLVLMIIGPEQAAAASRNTSSFSLEGSSCAPFAGGRIVGAEFGATVGMRVGVCWNGHQAFVIGDPSIPLPPSAIAGIGVPPGTDLGPGDSNVNPAQPQITSCGGDNLDDFATVSATSCTGIIDSAGTLHYTVHARVSAPFGIGQHVVTLSLVVDRNGHVLERP
jgi:hypothetical protein